LAAVESSEPEGDLTEHQKSFVRGEGDLAVAVEAAAVADPAVSAFDHPAARRNREPVLGFGTGYGVDGDRGFGGGIGDG
jgi:hypothetical protein